MRLARRQIQTLLEIYRFGAWSEGIRSVDLANLFGLSRGNICERLDSLKKMDLVSKEPYGKVKITEKGMERAARIKSSYEKIYAFFKEHVELESDQAQNCTLSCLANFSEECISKLEKKIETL